MVSKAKEREVVLKLNHVQTLSEEHFHKNVNLIYLDFYSPLTQLNTVRKRFIHHNCDRRKPGFQPLSDTWQLKFQFLLKWARLLRWALPGGGLVL